MDYAWFAFVTVASAAVGFALGVFGGGGDHYQRQFCERLAGMYLAKLAELQATLESVKGHEQHSGRQQTPGGGFAFKTSGAPAARAYAQANGNRSGPATPQDGTAPSGHTGPTGGPTALPPANA